MKKIYTMLLSAMAMGALISCQRAEFTEILPEKDGIRFAVSTRGRLEVSTRSADRTIEAQIIGSKDDTLYLSTEMEDMDASILATKVQPFGPSPDDAELTAFSVIAYTYPAGTPSDRSVWGREMKVEKSDVVEDGNTIWYPSGTYLYPNKQDWRLHFYTYAPYEINDFAESSFRFITTDDNGELMTPVLRYTVPAEQEDHLDLLVADREICAKAAGVVADQYGPAVALSFKHILAGVKFEVEDGLVINTITMSGFKDSGTYSYATDSWADLSGSASYVWNKADDTGSELLEAAMGYDESDEVYYHKVKSSYTAMMIPQNAAGIRIDVNLTDGTATKDISATVASGDWVAGKTTIYKISRVSYEYHIEVDESSLPTFDYTGSTDKVVRVKSYRIKNHSRKEAVPFTAVVDGATWASVGEYDGSTGSADEWLEVRLAVQAQEGISSAPKTHTETLAGNVARGTAQEPFDLSTHDVFGSENPTQNGGNVITANSYVVSAPGHYRLPLVYGNGIDYSKPGLTNGRNVQAYTGYLNHKDAAISSPYIYENTGCVPTGATYVWQYPAGLVQKDSVRLSADGHYLCFEVKRENICQGNAVIAVTNADGIVWSWHIWVTDLDMETVGMPYFTKSGLGTVPDGRVDMLRYNLGWVSPSGVTTSTTLYAARTFDLILQQGDRTSQTVTLTQSAHSVTRSDSESGGYNMSYQHGRKDPLYLPGNNSNISVTDYASGYQPQYGNNNLGGGRTLGTVIKTPYIVYGYKNGGDGSWTNVSYKNLWCVGYAGTPSTSLSTEVNTVKTVYDPCPPGFCVPSNNAFTGFTNNGSSVTSPTASNSRVSGAYDNGWNIRTDAGVPLYVPNQGTFYGTSFAANEGTYHTSISDGNFNIRMQIATNAISLNMQIYMGRAASIRPCREK